MPKLALLPLLLLCGLLHPLHDQLQLLALQLLDLLQGLLLEGLVDLLQLLHDLLHLRYDLLVKLPNYLQLLGVVLLNELQSLLLMCLV